MKRASTEVRRDRVREMYLERGLSPRDIVRELRKLRILTTRRNDSAERLVRADIAANDVELTAAEVSRSSDLAKARYRLRLERIFGASMAEFEKKVGETVTTSVFEYPNGGKMKVTSTRRGDPGGQRIRALAAALRANENIAKIEGAIGEPADKTMPGDERPYKGLIVDLAELQADERQRIEEQERRFYAEHGDKVN